MAVVIKRSLPMAGPLGSAPVSSMDPVKPRMVLRIGPKAVAKEPEGPPPEPLTKRQVAKLVDSGLMSPEDAALVSPMYEPMMLGDRVVITNSMFPWVQHYRPGDMGVITHVSSNRDPLGMDDNGHQIHVIKIDQPQEKSRIGQTAALFRWEFEKAKGH